MFLPQRVTLSNGFGRFIEDRKSPTVGRLKVLSRKSCFRRTASDQSHVEKDDIVKIFGNGLQVVMDDKDRFSGRTE